VWCDDFALTRQGNLTALRAPGLPTTVTIHNAAIDVTLRSADGTFAVKDHRTNRTWVQRMSESPVVVLDAKANGHTIDIRLLDLMSVRELTAKAQLDGDATGTGRHHSR